jgi:Rubrerythrin.
MKIKLDEEQSIISILKEAIKSEIDSEEKYLRAAEMAFDSRIRDFFLSLANMERQHKEQLTRQLAELSAEMTVVDEMNEMFL